MTDITNELREEIKERKALREQFLSKARDYKYTFPSVSRILELHTKDMTERIAQAESALDSNDTERMAAALEVLRRIEG